MKMTIRKTHHLYQVIVNDLKTVYQDTDLKKIKEYIRRTQGELKTQSIKAGCMSHQKHALSYSRTINW